MRPSTRWLAHLLLFCFSLTPGASAESWKAGVSKVRITPDRPLWVAGYSNDVFAYIPSRRVLEEGGYEASGAMIYYLQPGSFTPAVEETIIRRVHELVRRVRWPGCCVGDDEAAQLHSEPSAD